MELATLPRDNLAYVSIHRNRIDTSSFDIRVILSIFPMPKIYFRPLPPRTFEMKSKNLRGLHKSILERKMEKLGIREKSRKHQ